MKTTKHILCLVLALLFFAAYAEDTDCGALITTSTIEATAKVENLTGANAGKATITINNNSGTANAVTVYNAATIDTALSGKATTGDVTALQNRATSLENSTNNLTAALAAHTSASNNPHHVTAAQVGALTAEETHDAIMGCIIQPGQDIADNGYAVSLALLNNIGFLTEESDPTVPSWAKASSKPSYNFSEIGSKPTTISGYGITDAKIANGTITLGSNTITPVTTETDPIWASEKSGYVPTSRKVAGMALSSDITLKNLSIVGSSTTTYNGSGTASVNQTTQTQTSTTQNGTTGKNLTIQVAATSLDMGAYYIKIGTDGKPHLMLRQ